MRSEFSILYAEDYDDIREKYTRFLKTYFKNVYEARNGQEALDLFFAHKPSVVILDIHMPLLDGLEAAKKIKESKKDTRVIMLSAYSEKEKLLKAIDINVTKYLIKPVDTFEFEEMIEKMIDELHKESKSKGLLYLEGGFYWEHSSSLLYDREGAPLRLTKNETLLLKMFCANPNTVYSNNDILNFVWEFDPGDNYSTNKLRTLLSKLKNKISFNLFESIYNVGYKIKTKK